MRRPIKRRKEMPGDLVYNSPRVERLIRYLMWDGKKNTARRIVYDAFLLVKEKTNRDPAEVFEEAVRNAGPSVSVRSRRIGGANYQIPYEVSSEHRLMFALRWIIEAARGKKGAPMHRDLADEIIAAAKNEGEAIKKKENTHKMAEANKAFAHFSW